MSSKQHKLHKGADLKRAWSLMDRRSASFYDPDSQRLREKMRRRLMQKNFENSADDTQPSRGVLVEGNEHVPNVVLNVENSNAADPNIIYDESALEDAKLLDVTNGADGNLLPEESARDFVEETRLDQVLQQLATSSEDTVVFLPTSSKDVTFEQLSSGDISADIQTAQLPQDGPILAQKLRQNDSMIEISANMGKSSSLKRNQQWYEPEVQDHNGFGPAERQFDSASIENDSDIYADSPRDSPIVQTRFEPCNIGSGNAEERKQSPNEQNHVSFSDAVHYQKLLEERSIDEASNSSMEVSVDTPVPNGSLLQKDNLVQNHSLNEIISPEAKTATSEASKAVMSKNNDSWLKKIAEVVSRKRKKRFEKQLAVAHEAEHEALETPTPMTLNQQRAEPPAWVIAATDDPVLTPTPMSVPPSPEQRQNILQLATGTLLGNKGHTKKELEEEVDMMEILKMEPTAIPAQSTQPEKPTVLQKALEIVRGMSPMASLKDVPSRVVAADRMRRRSLTPTPERGQVQEVMPPRPVSTAFESLAKHELKLETSLPRPSSEWNGDALTPLSETNRAELIEALENLEMYSRTNIDFDQKSEGPTERSASPLRAPADDEFVIALSNMLENAFGDTQPAVDTRSVNYGAVVTLSRSLSLARSFNHHTGLEDLGVVKSQGESSGFSRSNTFKERCRTVSLLLPTNMFDGFAPTELQRRNTSGSRYASAESKPQHAFFDMLGVASSSTSLVEKTKATETEIDDSPAETLVENTPSKKSSAASESEPMDLLSALKSLDDQSPYMPSRSRTSSHAITLDSSEAFDRDQKGLFAKLTRTLSRLAMKPASTTSLDEQPVVITPRESSKMYKLSYDPIPNEGSENAEGRDRIDAIRDDDFDNLSIESDDMPIGEIYPSQTVEEHASAEDTNVADNCETDQEPHIERPKKNPRRKLDIVTAGIDGDIGVKSADAETVGRTKEDKKGLLKKFSKLFTFRKSDASDRSVDTMMHDSQPPSLDRNTASGVSVTSADGMHDIIDGSDSDKIVQIIATRLAHAASTRSKKEFKLFVKDLASILGQVAQDTEHDAPAVSAVMATIEAFEPLEPRQD